MERITDSNADLSVGTYAVFENIDGSRCVVHRSSILTVRIYNNFESRSGGINDTDCFRKYRFLRKVSCADGSLRISSIIYFLNSAYNAGWSIVSEDSRSKAENDVKQKKH